MFGITGICIKTFRSLRRYSNYFGSIMAILRINWRITDLSIVSKYLMDIIT